MHGKLPLWEKIHLSYLNFNLQVISIKKNSKTNVCDIEAIHCLIINNFCVLTQYVRITFSELCEV